jgi:hypothetical protein
LEAIIKGEAEVMVNAIADCSGMESALAIAERLVEKLKEAKSLADEIASLNIVVSLT